MPNQFLKPNALTLLMFRYQSPFVELETVVNDFFSHLSIAEARRRANSQSLPFPVFRSEAKNKKAKWLVSVEELALYLDKQAAIAKQDFNNMNRIGG
ncbi:pyocin activator PrtN family protein [Acinetobacter sp. ANC 5383]